MKKYRLVFSLSALGFLLIGFAACKKINEATNLGGDLIPAVDNVTTFEISLEAQTKNRLYDDTTRVLSTDHLALGYINDPVFGTTWAKAIDFTISPSSNGTYPFVHKDSVIAIDSVVLSLSLQTFYGDSNTAQTLRVYEVSPGAAFRADTLYRYKDPATDFAVGNQLSVGSKTYFVKDLNDSIKLSHPKDSSKVANVVRIKLDTAFGRRLTKYDTTNTANGGFRSDSIFRTLFKGLAVKADQTGNVLTYYSLNDVAKTKMTVYYRVHTTLGTIDTAAFDLYHRVNGQTNYTQMTAGADWAAGLSNPTPDKLFIQSTPSGSWASIRIPGLDTLKNKVVHRAELIATKLASTDDDKFKAPAQLFLARKNRNTPDTLLLFQNDLSVNLDGSLGFETFGGNLKGDNTYRFNITRYVQGIITRKENNDTLQLYAPLRTTVFVSNFGPKGNYLSIPVTPRVAEGRVVLASGTYGANPAARLRLRIIYSNL